jgi:surface protein
MSVIVVKSETNEYRILVKAGDEELARQEAVKAAISAEEARLSAIAAGDSEQVATEKAAQSLEDAAEALASKVDAESAATASEGFATDSNDSAVASEVARLASVAAQGIATTQAQNSSTSAGQSAESATAAEAAKNIVLANIIDPATQIEVSADVTALEAWRNKVIIVTNDSTITIPAQLFTDNWTFRVIVLNGFLQISKLGAKTFPFGNPEPLINPKSDFSIRQRGLTQEIIITGNIISTPFEASFQTQNILAGGSNDFQVRLPFSSISFEPVMVDWGDGTVESVTTFNAANTTKTYLVRGEYRIKIYGNIFFLQFNNEAERLKIGEIISWGGAVIGTSAFYGCENLSAIDVKDAPYNISTNISTAFRNCVNLTKVRGMNEWNTQNVINMAVMFYNATAFNTNIGSWNTQNVTNMGSMFNGATAFNTNIGSWNTQNVINMRQMFQNATAFNTNIGSWNTQNVTNMVDMFYNATAFNTNIGSWNTQNVTNMGSMFNGATAFNTNIGSWNTQNVTNMVSMFNGATAFNTNIGSWNTQNVTNMQQMFFSATAFNQNIGAWNVSNIINFINFMSNKTFANYSAANYNALLIGWASRPVQPNITISFGTIRYTSAASVARAVLTGSPNFWTIIDGGI